MFSFLPRFGGLLALGLLAAIGARAQAPVRSEIIPVAPSDEQSYSKEVVYGVNFNTQGGLLGGVSVRSSRVLDDRLLRFWSIEGVMLKNKAKELTINTIVGGSYVDRKTNYAFVLRPSIGMQRILFRKAADAGVQVNGLLSLGPSIGLLMPYYISYDYTAARTQVINIQTDDIRNEQYDPFKHVDPNVILDHGPLFSGIGETKVVPGFHLRGGLSFEYGRYRDAVTGLEAGVLIEGFTKRMVILSPGNLSETDRLNRQFFPSVYLTLYFGHRS
ncbi:MULTISPECIES: hypothetical protein [Hymenobacter]|uniref:Outer membrane protein beta-barrel domain-containing protein n=1 Tax=Hymenobacter armeniacus TaxID=2771358 RepID=A0ABR8JY46_9BACT|nr:MULTISPECIES: hypothetical protein [Hymenobacter]MBD2722879.1 hypothetical protein [Hymenobacter armeniacus]MBJ6108928.1 hypothetical protein [Hymenobacter sp. BT523]